MTAPPLRYRCPLLSALWEALGEAVTERSQRPPLPWRCKCGLLRAECRRHRGERPWWER